MEVLKKLSNKELLESMRAELRKAQNEISCANGDIKKANTRISFCHAIIKELSNENGDRQCN